MRERPRESPNRQRCNDGGLSFLVFFGDFSVVLNFFRNLFFNVAYSRQPKVVRRQLRIDSLKWCTWQRVRRGHCISTWSYENRVSKHFVIFLNFPCLIACLLCCLLMLLFLACFVVRDLCRSGCRQNYYLTHPPPSLFYFCPYPQFNN